MVKMKCRDCGLTDWVADSLAGRHVACPLCKGLVAPSAVACEFGEIGRAAAAFVPEVALIIVPRDRIVAVAGVPA